MKLRVAGEDERPLVEVDYFSRDKRFKAKAARIVARNGNKHLRQSLLGI
jgi:hypothetical protein